VGAKKRPDRFTDTHQVFFCLLLLKAHKIQDIHDFIISACRYLLIIIRADENQEKITLLSPTRQRIPEASPMHV